MWSPQHLDPWSRNLFNISSEDEFIPENIMNQLNSEQVDTTKLVFAGLYAAGTCLLNETSVRLLVQTFPYLFFYFCCDLVTDHVELSIIQEISFEKTVEFQSNVGTNTETSKNQCPICLEDMCPGCTDDPVVKIKNCPHIFHKVCIKAWYDHHSSSIPRCPLCKTFMK